jgi:hypothetical protein
MSCTLEYGPTDAYGTEVPAEQSPVTQNTAVTASVYGLEAGTEYHFRIKAVSTAGTAYGSGQTFTTEQVVSDPVIPVSGVSLDRSELTITVGEGAATLTATVEPGDATNKNVTWSSSDEAVATVSESSDNSALITPVSAGSAVITVTTGDGAFTAECSVTVNPPSSSAPVVDSYTDPFPTHVTTVKVTDGGEEVVSALAIRWTDESDGTRKAQVDFPFHKAVEAAGGLKENDRNTAYLIIPDNNDEMDQLLITITEAAAAYLAQEGINLQIYTENACLFLPAASLQQPGRDLYFRVVPVKNEQLRMQLEQQVVQEEMVLQAAGGSGIQIIGRTATIETNLQSRAVQVTLPLTGVDEHFQDNLFVFIAHSDGDKVLTRGEPVSFNKNIPGIQFWITKFSTFTVISVKPAAGEDPPETDQEPAPVPEPGDNENTELPKTGGASAPYFIAAVILLAAGHKLRKTNKR